MKFFIFFFLLSSIYLIGGDQEEKGTLIVTYQTDSQGSRLDRIRFWIINEKNEKSLYPKKDEFISNHHSNTEKTVVATLPKGFYKIKFILPNADQYFKGVPDKEFEIIPQKTTKIDQEIFINKKEKKETEDLASLVIENYPLTPLPPPLPLPPMPYGSLPGIPLQLAQFNLNVTRPIAWKLMLRGKIVYSAEGSVVNLPVPPGRNYYILADELPGYTLKMIPESPFDIEPGSSTTVEIFYERDFGFVSLEAVLPPGENALNILLTPLQEQQQPYQIRLNASEGQVAWKSGPLETGEYLVSYQLSSNVLPPPNQPILILKGRTVRLTPRFISKGSLQVNTDLSQAIFYVNNEFGERVGQGSGINASIHGLERGYYTIEFSSTDKQLYVPPENQRIFVAPNQTSKINASYEKRGKLTVKSNLPAILEIHPLQTKIPPFQEKMEETTKDFFLPEGKYKLRLAPPDAPPSSIIEVNIRTSSPQIIYLSSKKEGSKKEKSDVPQAPPFSSELKGKFLDIPEGIAIVGGGKERPQKEMNISAFQIGAAEVTNREYADWLNSAIQSKTVRTHENNPGYIVNQEGLLLCKILGGSPYSQIQAVGNQFLPLPGKEHHPVIEVTWWGAHTYCKQNGCRLPTENEWEKAAGMSLVGQPIRYLYGFGKDTINRSWANYRYETEILSEKRVLTTPVGFYNGKTYLPLIISDTKQQRTEDAKSPAGAYDMSGNVWEWVSSWDEMDSKDIYKIAKGGSFNSFAEDLQVSARRALPMEYSDIYTGFRTAKN